MRKDSGFIALMSAILISLILMTVAVAVSFSGFYGRFNILDSTIKDMSSGLAEACLENARVGVAGNASYGGNEEFDVTAAGDKCFVSPIVSCSGNYKVVTKGVYNDSYTNLRAYINGTNFSIVSLEEIPVYTAPTCP